MRQKTYLVFGLAALLVLLCCLASLVNATETCQDGRKLEDGNSEDEYDEDSNDGYDEDDYDAYDGSDEARRELGPCERDPLRPPFLDAGDLGLLFQELIEEFEEDPDMQVTVHSKDPWIISVDNFLSEEEVEDLLAIAGDDFEPSQELSAQKLKDGKYSSNSMETKHRTSETKFCTDTCAKSSAVTAVQDRVSDILGIEEDAMEFIQFVRYLPGQYYRQHHDSSAAYATMPMGHRVITVFMYLNTIERGGETSFPRVNIKVKPVRGRAVIWTNVLDSNPDERDMRTIHEALPNDSEEIKIAANFWLYQYDYRSYWPACTG
mmetsp:Transcript_13844/g.26874  ORF Transcript_13844/g.26874 Transcript_13844/m.26874 type:complete len:320 (+) Transcript_13844:24-983(+)